LDQLLSIEKLRGIQWIPGAGAPPPEKWLPLLKRIHDGGKLCQVYGAPEGAKTIIRELGCKGFCFVIFERIKSKDIPDFPEFIDGESNYHFSRLMSSRCVTLMNTEFAI